MGKSAHLVLLLKKKKNQQIWLIIHKEQPGANEWAGNPTHTGLSDMTPAPAKASSPVMQRIFLSSFRQGIPLL